MDTDLAELTRTVRYLKDRQDILDCIQRESRARDRQDVEQIEGCWWPDGVDEHGPVITRVPDYAARANAGHRGGFHMTSHNITNHLCEIDGDTAHCESYVIGGLYWLSGEKTSIAFGRYLDRMERRDGEWRMHTRKCTIEMTCDGDASWIHAKAIQGFLKPIWGKDDPSYERPFEASTEGLRY